MAGLTTDGLRRGFIRIGAGMEQAAAELCELDGKIGDGDLGITMQRGCREVMQELPNLPDDVGLALMKCAQAFTRISGSTFGTLLATGLMSAAKTTKGRSDVPWSETSALLDSAVQAMMLRGKAALGDKTVLDAFDAAAQATKGKNGPAEILDSAIAAVTDTLGRFRGTQAKQGRARIFGEKTLGLDDPGMVALLRILESLREHMSGMRGKLETPPEGYVAYSPETLRTYLATKPKLALHLGGTLAQWQIEEVGDGNLNLVFLIHGPSGALCAKQALPYVRLVGESWPLPLSRAHFEHIALVEEAKHVPDLVPRVHHHDPIAAMTIMDCLDGHIIMRKGMIAGVRYPLFSTHTARFMAETLFRTSDLALPAGEKKRRIAELSGNIMLWKITEDLIFTDPYYEAELNRWTRPHLDQTAAEIRADVPLKAAVSELKEKFLTETQAMIHGDLHTGSIMITQDSTKMIDPEFVMYGPMGFDTGAVIGNLLLSYFSQDGHAEQPGARRDYQEWILQQIDAVWAEFEQRFLALWNNHHTGDLYPRVLFAQHDSAPYEAIQRAYMRRLFADTLGFGAAKMIRRILGLAHVIDLDSIADPELRARCERRALRVARYMMVQRHTIRSMTEVADAARVMLKE